MDCIDGKTVNGIGVDHSRYPGRSFVCLYYCCKSTVKILYFLKQHFEVSIEWESGEWGEEIPFCIVLSDQCNQRFCIPWNAMILRVDSSTVCFRFICIGCILNYAIVMSSWVIVLNILCILWAHTVGGHD